jgi:hypothetical protein
VVNRPVESAGQGLPAVAQVTPALTATSLTCQIV